MSQAFELKRSKYKNLKKILKETVETTRETLECDRVIVYNAINLPKAGVLAESVDKQFPSILGQVIQDPFLEGDYLEMYCYGMSLTIDDIYTSDIGEKELKNLEKLSIKSVAVAPIYIDKKILAFLVAHQCRITQPWDLNAVGFLAEMANTAGKFFSSITDVERSKYFNFVPQIEEIDRRPNIPKTSGDNNGIPEKSKETPTEKLKSQLFADLKSRTMAEQDSQQILNMVVVELRQLLECDRVLIYSFERAEKQILAESLGSAWTITATQASEKLNLFLNYLEKKENGKVLAWDETSQKNIPLWYQTQLNTLRVKAGLIAPIKRFNKPFGMLIAHQCSNLHSWQKQEIDWVTQIANYIGTMLEQTKNGNVKNRNTQATVANVQKQLERERMWTKHFTGVIQKIRVSLKTEDILKASVREVHTILKCDRALVYALDKDSYGKIVAESVSPGWTKAEGRVIKDPCFEARYLEKYRDGRFRAWNNIYETGMTSCHIEQLERLEVKANLVVPIISEEKLFGLLVAHQCSNTRQWQKTEILWLTQIATQMGFALDNAQLLEDARRLRQQAEQERIWTEYFTDAVQQIRQSLKTKDVYQASVREVRRVLKCDRVLVYSLNQDKYGEIVAESVAHGWTRGEGRVIKDPCFEVRYLDKYRDGRVRVWNDIYEAEMASCYREQLEQLEVKATLVVPIVSEGKLFGLLVAQQCSGSRQWQQVEIDWLARIATQVFFAQENAQMQQQIEQYTKDTQGILNRAATSRANIQRTVQNVTVGLGNLHNSCQSFAEVIQQVKDLSKQLAQQSMNMTRLINLSQADGSEQNSVIDLSDKIFSLMQELFEATAKIDPLFTTIKTEISSKTTTLESETLHLDSGVEDFQNASQQLDKIIALNLEMSDLIKISSDALESQIQSSTFAKDSVMELTDITERISNQSITIIESFNQLGRILS